MVSMFGGADDNFGFTEEAYKLVKANELLKVIAERANEKEFKFRSQCEINDYYPVIIKHVGTEMVRQNPCHS